MEVIILINYFLKKKNQGFTQWIKNYNLCLTFLEIQTLESLSKKIY